MQASEIRRTFLSFFEERGHRVVPSSSLIPNDPTLLLSNAGMNQFKPYFLGLQEPPYPRATSVQKCFRTVDIENVGHTARHLTFFEMLGNFSFGDYFKLDAIRWAWELSTERFGLDPERLWVTIYQDDDEAETIWRDEVGVPPERIVRMGMDDNYWSMGVAGPCGPCSEIYFDRGPEFGAPGGPAVDPDRYLEFWNLVFMQNERDDAYNILGPLPRQNIDTGMGLERMAIIQQGVPTLFETDLIRPLVERAEHLAGRRYGEDRKTDVSLRIMAEHGRATTFLMADGVLPSNEGRGYVLRRMLRRVVTHARRLGIERPVLGDLVETSVAVMSDAYPELRENRAFVEQVAASEEQRFSETYAHGIALFEQEVRAAKGRGSTAFPGEAAFRLHDTFGFQEQLTVELATEEGLAVDTEAFARLMEQQRRRAQEHAKKGDVAEGPLGEIAAAAGPTDFLGYERLESEGKVVGVVVDGEAADVASEGRHTRLVLDRTPFYAEGGGQVGDAGTIVTAGGRLRVTATRPGPGGTMVHEGVVEAGEIRRGDAAQAAVDPAWRAGSARSHTGTHVLHHTLRRLLGEHARQAGSLITPGRLRFDFTHYEGLSHGLLQEIEAQANGRLVGDDPVRTYETTFDYAKSQGATALFGEKYGEIVRVVEIGDYSVELCGGTHVVRTGEVGFLRLVSEGSIGSGFRRIEGLVGPDALRQVNLERRLLEEITEAAGGGDPATAPERIRRAMGRIKELESELGRIRRAEQQREVAALAGSATEAAPGVWAVAEVYRGRGVGELRELAQALRARLAGRPAAAVLGTVEDGKAQLVVACTDELLARGITARRLLDAAAGQIGGRGGGKDALAIGGGPNAAGIGEARAAALRRLAELAAGG